MQMEPHRTAAVAGRFYPGEAARLRAEVQSHLEAAAALPAAAQVHAPKLLVVPHAGFVYSGPVAAFAYAALAPWRQRIRRVVLLGPAHRVAVHGLALPTVAAFDTPLGPVAVDGHARQALAGLAQVVASDAAHAAEHSLEVQLPFLQAVLGEFTLVPLVVGRASAEEVAEVLERLWGGDETLIVISTDLSHYLPYAEARRVDAGTVQRVLRLDASIAHDEACGATPLNGALLQAARHGLAPRLLDLRNSGDTAGDRSRVVGYGALAFEPAAGRDGDRARDAGQDADDALGPALLSRARNAIASVLGLPLRAEPHHPALRPPGATFVTLRRQGQLRGCIGRLEAGSHPLEDDVRHNARRAAFHDPRFAPLTMQEWADLEVEVSLLEVPEPLAVDSEAHALRLLRPGLDGVIFAWREQRSTFLPQVWEQLPEPAEFLAHLKRKAGLPAAFWHAEVRLSRYGVRKFKESTDTPEAA